MSRKRRSKCQATTPVGSTFKNPRRDQRDQQAGRFDISDSEWMEVTANRPSNANDPAQQQQQVQQNTSMLMFVNVAAQGTQQQPGRPTKTKSENGSRKKDQDSATRWLS